MADASEPLAGGAAGSSLVSGPPVFRFAPSPNGRLHLGHALSALTGFEMARRLGGRFLVRIEDIDVVRARDAFVEGILADLRWLGISWEEPVLVQSRHFGDYLAAAQRLESEGLLYPCFASRAEIADASAVHPECVDPDGAPLYPGLHKGMPQAEVAARRARGEPFALRLDMERAMDRASELLGDRPLSFIELSADGSTETRMVDPRRWGDAVIVRKDVPASYHLAVVVDDARQEVTHVTRGIDLLPATDLHRLLQLLLGLPQPVYHHHRLIADAAGRKLSKSAGDTALATLRAAGVTPDEVRARLGLSPGVARDSGETATG